MEYKILKTKGEHQAALEEAEALVALDPSSTTPQGQRLELLSLLIEDYEKRRYDFGGLDPIDVIEFKMNEQGLRQRDLVPLLGSRSRVSEVLARKRPLTVQMIRALSTGLGIPADALIGDDLTLAEPARSAETSIEWKYFPYSEMQRRGWFGAARVTGSTNEERLRSFLSQVLPDRAPATQFFRRKMSGE